MSDSDPSAINVAVNSVEEMAKATKNIVEIIKNIDDILEKTSRSARIEVLNTTSQAIRATWNGDGHSWGGFVAPLPDPSIAPYGMNVFGSASHGGASGTTGSIFYVVDDEGTTWHVRWDVPFAASNTAAAQVVGAHADWYEALTIPPAGGNKRVPMRFILLERAIVSKNREGDWQTCGECKALVHTLQGGRCPGSPSRGKTERGVPIWVPGLDGKPHELSEEVPVFSQFGPHHPAGGVFQLFHTSPGPSREEGWRRCAKCKLVFYDGYDDNKGRCADVFAEHGHVAESGGYPYILQMNVVPRADQQIDWRFCNACLGLFYLPHNADGNCAAGGVHKPGADRYVLTRRP